jgi:predicted metal-dependent hydrolase
VTPHPVTDPAGHSYGQADGGEVTFEPERWRDCEPYVQGLRLFNRGYYWEAHEVWESAWLSVGRAGPAADFLKGLIKWAAAGVKVREGRINGVARHLRRAAELLQAVAVDVTDDAFAGQSLGAMRAAVQFVIENPPAARRATNGRPQVHWAFRLNE